MKFPDYCPFTGVSKLAGRIHITRARMQLFLPIPFIGWFSLKKEGRISLPAGAVIAWGEKLLTLLSWIALVGGVAACVVLGKKSQASEIYDSRDTYFLVGGFLAFYLLKIIRWLCLSRARIARVGMGGLEVRFTSEQYAREFARMNDLHASDHRSKKRPVDVNALR